MEAKADSGRGEGPASRGLTFLFTPIPRSSRAFAAARQQNFIQASHRPKVSRGPETSARRKTVPARPEPPTGPLPPHRSATRVMVARPAGMLQGGRPHKVAAAASRSTVRVAGSVPETRIHRGIRGGDGDMRRRSKRSPSCRSWTGASFGIISIESGRCGVLCGPGEQGGGREGGPVGGRLVRGPYHASPGRGRRGGRGLSGLRGRRLAPRLARGVRRACCGTPVHRSHGSG